MDATPFRALSAYPVLMESRVIKNTASPQIIPAAKPKPNKFNFIYLLLSSIYISKSTISINDLSTKFSDDSEKLF
jgi:hypothetical protein